MSAAFKHRKKAIRDLQKKLGTKRLEPEQMPRTPPEGTGPKPICTNCGEPGPHFVPPSFGDPGFFACTHPKPLCPNCGEPGPHFVPPSFGDPGFFACTQRKEISPQLPEAV